MQSNKESFCPVCGQTDKVYKVSSIYLDGTALIHNQRTAKTSSMRTLVEDITGPDMEAPSKAIAMLVQKFQPPAGKNRVSRLIHPDGMIVFVGIVFLLMLSRTYSDPGRPWVGLLVATLVFFLLYVFLRKMIIKRYDQSKLREQEEIARIERAIARWMSFFYCSRDAICFEPQSQKVITPEEFQNYIRELGRS